MYAFCVSHPFPPQKRTAYSTRQLTTPSAPFATLAPMKVDAHVHIWDSEFPPHPEHPLPSIIGAVDDLIKNMNVAGVDKAMVVQPINYMFDHTYVRAAIRSFPTRLFAIGLANTTVSPDQACKEMEGLIQDGFRGVRINPNFTGDSFQHEMVVAVTRKASELDVPVALFAQPKHVPQLEHLLLSCPQTKILLDHFAFAAPDDESTQLAVIELMRRYPNLFIKASAWFRVSKCGWPHEDMYPFLNSLIQAVGSDRLLVGSDYPFVKEQYDYANSFSVLDVAVRDFERQCLQGGSAKDLYKL